jgi:hypothetical protein
MSNCNWACPCCSFFVGIPRRQDATHLAPHPLDGIGMSSAEIIFSTAASVFLESGIEAKCRTKQMFLYPIPNRGKDISSINTLEFLLRKQARMIVCHTIEEL